MSFWRLFLLYQIKIRFSASVFTFFRLLALETVLRLFPNCYFAEGMNSSCLITHMYFIKLFFNILKSFCTTQLYNRPGYFSVVNEWVIIVVPSPLIRLE